MEKKEKALDHKGVELEGKGKALDQKEKNLVEKEMSLDQKRVEFEGLGTLEEKENALKANRKYLEEKEKVLESQKNQDHPNFTRSKKLNLLKAKVDEIRTRKISSIENFDKKQKKRFGVGKPFKDVNSKENRSNQNTKDSLKPIDSKRKRPFLSESTASSHQRRPKSLVFYNSLFSNSI